MKRPAIVTVFAAMLSLEAFYELVLFPLSYKSPEFQPLLEQLAISMDIIVPFGFVKGVYALLGAIGLWVGFRYAPFFLWFATPLFPIASVFLIGSVQLSPLSIPLSIAYVFYLRRPEIKPWFDKIELTTESNEVVTKVVLIESAKKQFKPSFQRVALFFAGYILLNTISSISMLSMPVDVDSLVVILFELSLFSVILLAVFKLGKVPVWKPKIGTMLFYTGLFGLFYSLLLYSVLESPSAEALNKVMSGNLTSRFVLMNALYSVFIILIGFPLRAKKEE